jgi:predicted TIM-barrel fold metal-dependent hydrolase
MLLADLIEANPKTKFILMHGGYPWLGETAVLAMKFSSNVWVDTKCSIAVGLVNSDRCPQCGSPWQRVP